MSSIQTILAQMAEAVSNPASTVSNYRERTGKGAVGCIAPYTPEELVHAAGMLPVGLWGGQVELNKVRATLPPFACSIMQSVKELELNGAYDGLTAVLCPSACDTLKAIGQKWTRKDVPMIPFVHPHNRQLPAARVFLAKEYLSVKKRLEQAAGTAISDEAIQASIAVYNEHRAAMRAFADAAGAHPGQISPKARHLVFKSAFFMRKEEHTALVRELNSLLNALPEESWKGPRVILSGILAEPDCVLDTFADLGIAIAADDLAQESRQSRVDVPDGGDPLERLAAQWQAMYGCSLAYEHQKSRVPMLAEMCQRYHADGVVVAIMIFCDPEEFDYPMIKQAMEAAGIPLLQIEIDQQAQSVEQLRTRLQSFAEILQAR